MPDPDVSVIVVNWNGRHWLEGCLAALERQRGVRHEVILVDNGSSDGSADYVSARFPGTRVVRLGANRGFSGGNNAGAREARGRFLAFLNNDTEAEPDWLGGLVAGLESHPDAGLAASRVVYLDAPETIDSAGDGWTWYGAAFKRGHGQPASRWLTPGETFGACGAACLIRRPLFEALGGFDERLFVTFEDVDLSYRVRLAGYTCRYVPGAIVRHAGSATLGRESEQAVRWGQRNVELVYLTNTPTPLLAVTLPAHVVYLLAGACYFAGQGRFAAFFSGKVDAMKCLPQLPARRRRVHASRRISVRAMAAAFDTGLTAKWREKTAMRRAEAP